ncbi:MAG: ferrous iron transport protein A [Chlorobiales bacterium]|nr:ferrous iron transport protein A [Chlorobiales bacterium]
MNLSELTKGQSGKIVKISATSAFKKRLLDMGVLVGERIRIERVAPLGDPVEVSIKNYRLSLRKKETEDIVIEEVQ